MIKSIPVCKDLLIIFQMKHFQSWSIILKRRLFNYAYIVPSQIQFSQRMEIEKCLRRDLRQLIFSQTEPVEWLWRRKQLHKLLAQDRPNNNGPIDSEPLMNLLRLMKWFVFARRSLKVINWTRLMFFHNSSPLFAHEFRPGFAGKVFATASLELRGRKEADSSIINARNHRLSPRN